MDKYTWVDVGSSYLPSDILAALLFAQLEARDDDPGAAHGVWDTLRRAAGRLGGRAGVRLPVVPDDCEQAYHMFYLLVPSLEAGRRLIAHLRARRQQRVPLPAAAPVRMGRQFGGRGATAR